MQRVESGRKEESNHSSLSGKVEVKSYPPATDVFHLLERTQLQIHLVYYLERDVQKSRLRKEFRLVENKQTCNPPINPYNHVTQMVIVLESLYDGFSLLKNEKTESDCPAVNVCFEMDH